MPAPKPHHIAYLDGLRYRRAILAGAQALMAHSRELDAINVFPVPDSDTGTNLKALCQQLMLSLSTWQDRRIDRTASVVGEAALMGARGNSGAIFAQFFCGLSDALHGRTRVETAHFGQALLHAARTAYQALAEPREGTILSVARVWAEAFARQAEKTTDFLLLLEETLPTAEQALQATEEQLDVLHEAHVVDAGALGFVHFLRGIYTYIHEGPLAPPIQFPASEEITTSPVHHLADGSAYRYCTEGLLSGKYLSHEALQHVLSPLGDSLIIAGGTRLVRFHIHTNQPHEVFKRLRRMGQLAAEKVDDIYLQTRPMETNVAVVTDSGCDLPEMIRDQYGIFTVPYRLLFCEESFLDRYGITPEEFFEWLEHHPCHPTTSQPSPADLKRVYEQALHRAERVISIHVTSKHSGTYQSALHVARAFGERIHVVDSRSISIGIGLLALTAAEGAHQYLPFEEILHRVYTARKHLRAYLTLETLEYLVRGGRVSTLKGFIGRLLNVKPLLMIDEEGVLKPAGQAFNREKALQQVLRHSLTYAKTLQYPRFAVAHARAPEAAQWFAEEIRKAYGNDVELYMTVLSPALSVHAGPGAAGIGVTERFPA